MTSVEAEAFNEAQILISYDRTHAINRKSSDYLPTVYLNKFMEFGQLRRDEFYADINLCDYPLPLHRAYWSVG